MQSDFKFPTTAMYQLKAKKKKKNPSYDTADMYLLVILSPQAFAYRIRTKASPSSHSLH